MKRWGLVILALGVWLAAPARAERHRLQADPVRYEVAGAREIRIDFPVGELRVEGDDGDDVRMTVEVRCDRGSLEDCQERARKVTVQRNLEGGTLRFEFDGVPKMNSRGLTLHVHALVPRALSHRIEMGVGELDITGIAGSLEASLGVGELHIRGRTADYRKVNADVGVGDASLRTRDQRVQGNGFIGRELRWSGGSGPSSMRAHIGVGQVTVTLD
jgi:hypothetical protein